MQKRRIWDITPPLDAATPVFPGDTPFAVRWLSRLENGAGANVSEITFTPHDGAHADAPLHLDSAADDVASLRLETFIGRALVIDLSLDDSLEPIGPEALTANTFPARILFKTRTKRPATWTPDFRALSPALMRRLAEEGAALVGTDAPSVDPAESELLVSHRIALANRMTILENLDLSDVPGGEYELIALPLPLKGVEASPVRAILRSLSSRI